MVLLSILLFYIHGNWELYINFFLRIVLTFVDKVLNNDRTVLISVSFFDSLKKENIRENWIESKKNREQVAAGSQNGGRVVDHSRRGQATWHEVRK